MNRKERRAAKKTGGPAITPMASTLAQAFRAHQAGHQSDAERLYRDVLATEPRNAPALHLLGALLHQRGQNDEAITLMRQAIAIEPRNPDYHYNLGTVFNASGRMADAIEPLSKAIALKPQYAEAHFELGNAYARAGQLDSAEKNLRRALDLQPANAATMNNLGRVLRAMRRPEDAAAIWQRAVTLQPGLAVAHLNIGMVRSEQNRLDDAEESLRRVLSLQPDHPDAIYQLAAVMIRRDRAHEALPLLAQALSKSESADLRAMFAHCMLASREIRPEPALRDLFRRAIEEAWLRPAILAPLGIVILKAHPAIGAAIRRVAEQWGKVPPSHLLPTDTEVTAVAEEPLVRLLLEAAPNGDVDIERFLTVLRAGMLNRVQDGDALSNSVIDLYASLAHQCFFNEYVFSETDDERRRIDALQMAIATAIRSNEPVAAIRLIAFAAYRPLHSLDGAASLAKRNWPAAVAALLRQQVDEPLQEAALRGTLTTLTPVAVETDELGPSGPSPRWGKAVSTLQPRSIEDVARNYLSYPGALTLDLAAAPDVLIAGCGTGETAIEAALSYDGARVLAVDDNEDDLAYGRRRAQSLNLNKIEFARADIAKLATIGRSFDVIEVFGLERFSDPLAVWSELIQLLRAGGAMRIGLLSANAHRVLAAAQDFARQGNYQADAEGIRLLRQNLLRQPADSAAARAILGSDFFATGTCRKLFFGTDGRPLTLADIQTFLSANGLEVLGIETTLELQQGFAKRFPDPGARTDLAAWRAFEREHPDTFVASYQLWLRKHHALGS